MKDELYLTIVLELDIGDNNCISRFVETLFINVQIIAWESRYCKCKCNPFLQLAISPRFLTLNVYIYFDYEFSEILHHLYFLL